MALQNGPILRFSTLNQDWVIQDFELSETYSVSGLCPGPDGKLAVLERDKLRFGEAEHKKVYLVETRDFDSPTLSKNELLDVLDEYRNRRIPIPQKPEGLAFDGEHFWVVNDNDAMKGSFGESILLELRTSSTTKSEVN